MRRPRRENPAGTTRRHQVQYKGRARRRGGVYPPMVCLTGYWLEDAGFPYGQPFQVKVEEGRLVLKTV